jgi:hypothetical protein
VTADGYLYGNLGVSRGLGLVHNVVPACCIGPCQLWYNNITTDGYLYGELGVSRGLG